MLKQSSLSKFDMATIIALLFASGLLALAIIDEQYRPIFADLAKVCVGGYIGMLIPRK